MMISSTKSNEVQRLAGLVHRAHDDARQALLDGVARSFFVATGDLLASLSAEAALGRAESYTRHIAYADPGGAFTMMLLVWRPGQYSPVHAHHTWCAYKVLRGTLEEQHFRWDEAARTARLIREVARKEGSISASLPGLDRVHRLGNASGEVAISLHIYGVDQANIATGINLVLEAAGGIEAAARPAH